MRQAIAAADGLPVTLHRAFDMCQDPCATLDLAAQIGVDTILTSGQGADAVQGIPALKQLQAYSAGRVTVMACGAVNAQKIATVHAQTGVTTFHMAGLQLCQSAMQYRNNDLSMGSKEFDEFALRKASPSLFQQAVATRDAINSTME